MDICVSIVVAVYNVEDYLEKCIHSLINQTYYNIEIILVDDGSPDSCRDICDKYSLIDSRVKVIHKENGGLVSARKSGLKKAHGKYILFVDGDDWMDNNTIETLVTKAEATGAEMVINAYNENYETKEIHKIMNIDVGYYEGTALERIKTEYLFLSDMKKGFRFGVNPAVWNKLLLTKTVKEVYQKVPDKITLGEDAAITVPYAFKAVSILIIDSPGYYHYCKRKNSMTGAYNPHLTDNIFNLITYMSDLSWANEEKQIKFYICYLLAGIVDNLLKMKASMKKRNSELDKARKNKYIINALSNILSERSNDLPLYYKIIFTLFIKKMYRSIQICCMVKNKLKQVKNIFNL